MTVPDVAVVDQWLLTYDHRNRVIEAVGPDVPAVDFTPLNNYADELIMAIGLPLDEISNDWENLDFDNQDVDEYPAPGIIRLTRYIGYPDDDEIERVTTPIDASDL